MLGFGGTPDAAKVLRIGLVIDNKVVHERLIRPGQNVTVGESPRNTFVVPNASLPNRFMLFQAKGGKYSLNITDQMSGKIALDSFIAMVILLENAKRLHAAFDPNRTGTASFDMNQFVWALALL